jgi:hypothetical protein
MNRRMNPVLKTLAITPSIAPCHKEGGSFSHFKSPTYQKAQRSHFGITIALVFTPKSNH